MLSEASSSSWHPAFMPNSAADIIHIQPLEASSISDPAPAEESPAAELVEEPDLRISVPDHGSVNGDNPEHAELTNLRDALTTSLASPGGVEMNESPEHNGITNHDTSEIQPFDSPKADFPTAGPTHESRHQSTTSFARTVSHEVNWGEDDEVDPEWNLHRTDTDPFKLMAQSDRTNSFPAVPPLHSADSHHVAEPLPHSQAEDIMDSNEQPQKDIFDDVDVDEGDFFAKSSNSHEPEQGFPFEPQSETFDQHQMLGGEIREERDEESQARFEEGLPLVQSQAQEVNTSIEGRTPDFTSAFTDDAGEDDFFAQVSKPAVSEPEPRPDSLERKSTIQVMNSMKFTPRDGVQGDIPEVTEETGDVSSPQSSLEKATGGGLGASKSTILAQVLGDAENPISESTEGLSGLEEKTEEGDLAAMWQAALEEDDFLDDDELLEDDSATENNAVDPAAFFGSDDEGFLEDTDDQLQSQENHTQSGSPSIPSPVTGANGKIVGFDSLSGSALANQTGSSRYVPAGANVPRQEQPRTSYTPTAPLLTDLSKPSNVPTASSPYMSPAIGFPGQLQPQPARPEMPKAQSFADKAKGGYSSPYDLPMEVVKPRRRVGVQQMGRGYSASAAPPSTAPPRSSSRQGQMPPPMRSSSSMSPPTSSHGMQTQSAPLPAAGVSQARPSSAQSKAGFFEDLPMSSRPKPAPRQSARGSSPSIYSPANTMQPTVPLPGQSPYAMPQPPQNIPSEPPLQGLVAPQRVNPYANLPAAASILPPSNASRYSPAPQQPGAQGAPPPMAQSRYSPAPPTQRQQSSTYTAAPAVTQPPPPVLPHLPRTSSPLAHFERTTQEFRPHGSVEHLNYDRRSSSSGYEPGLRTHPLPPTREVDETEASANKSIAPLHNPYFPRQSTQTPPPPQGLATKNLISPPKRAVSGYMPQYANGAPLQRDFAPPKRSQTQSPGHAFAGPKLEMGAHDPYARPASVHAPTSPSANAAPYASMTAVSSGRPRGFSQNLDYIAPTDGLENDSLQRWRGAPVFAWGVGGTLITSFPKDIPRYGMNQALPKIIRSPGEVKVRNIKDVCALEERLISFPGPLKGKSKKKDLLTWLNTGIANLEQPDYQIPPVMASTHESKRKEERVLLWKILQIFIENDGVLEGNPAVEKSVRAVLTPGLDDEAQPESSYESGLNQMSITPSATSNPRADPVDPAAIDQIRRHLLRGDRDKAVWEAVDKRLWAHAMLISHTVSKDVYKQVAQEFIQKEVKNIGENTESLSALYEIFAGNFEESIDELVPPSARAGFQMVSTSNVTGPSKDSLEGLDRWRETLGLVLSNRSTDDNQALNALGKLLSGYGRAEAAHICFLFARTNSVFGGVDDPHSSIVLVGSDHQRQPYEFDKELEPILLSEVYEYGLTLSNTSVAALSMPHLAVYKLQHATVLAEYGQRDKALQYCEAIASSITSQTKRSPYHHPLLVGALDDLSKRLKQSPKDENSSWISKPSIDKVSGSVWAKFNKFVAGEENDGSVDGSATGAGSEIGPFARIAGGTPTISRSPSVSDIYGSYGNLGMNTSNGGIPIPTASKTSSRYAPGGSYTPPTTYEPQLGSSYGSQSRASFEQRSSSELKRGPYESMRQSSDYRPASQAGSLSNSYAPLSNSGYAPQSTYAPYGGASTASLTENPSAYAQQSPSTPISDRPPHSNMYDSPRSIANSDMPHVAASYTPPQPSYEPHVSTGYEPLAADSYEPPTSTGYEPPSSSGYEPPSSGYEPPAYEPATMNDEPDSPVTTKPKKKSFMDDDDDISTAPAASGGKTKAEKDREADEAFRKAAEADAQRAKEAAAPKKGWGLGGWFGGGKKEAAPDMSQPGKPIRAKLGEASSFVYDPELKRWVNKKGGTDATPTPSATPPPPRGAGPPRTASGPPSMPTSDPRPSSAIGDGPPGVRSTQSMSDVNRAASDSAPPGPLGPASLGAPPAMSRSVSNGSLAGGPPSRPGTSMSNASSIDDLLGPATGGRKTVGKGKKKGRGYIDVMGEKK
ncbi:hypothetical protein BP5796_00068 [Coleophoma crateriformis]|uniref:Protein transport protein sec16 n=1 Tax=Coleophoma crateriformis TaxID=565419 RepID=A0A3D8T6X6_9HELO|nr:hypothetical protein BP5796_00068 [Coleophoma crateriformis]